MHQNCIFFLSSSQPHSRVYVLHRKFSSPPSLALKIIVNINLVYNVDSFFPHWAIKLCWIDNENLFERY